MDFILFLQVHALVAMANVQLYLILLIYIRTLSMNANPNRKWWILPRSAYWFPEIVLGLGPRDFLEAERNREYVQAVRVDSETFWYICDVLESLIKRQDTNYKKALRVEVRVAIALYRLGHGASYRDLAHLFGVSPAFCHKVCEEIFRELWNRREDFITWGDDARRKATLRKFKGRWLPGCIGAIDGFHIPVECPKCKDKDYRNRKGWHSIILQGVVDADGRFVDVDIGMPGWNHDSHVFKTSHFFKHKASHHYGMSHVGMRVGDSTIKCYIIGDACYPISSFLIKGYPGQNLTREQAFFNHTLDRARLKVEQTFGKLKKRFRLLACATKSEVRVHCLATGAACVLHNICVERMQSGTSGAKRKRGEDVPREVFGDEEPIVMEQPDDGEEWDVEVEGPEKERGEAVRDLLMEHLITNNSYFRTWEP